MLLKLIRLLFDKVIGDVPAEERDRLKADLESLLIQATKAAAEGAVRGMK